MSSSPLAGKPAPADLLIDPDQVLSAYYDVAPDPTVAAQLVSFGTSGHRGSPLTASFNEAHILAMTQAICDYRRAQRIDGPLFMGKDSHAPSGPAQRTALEVLAGNAVPTLIQHGDGLTPTPAVSFAILAHNRGRKTGPDLADGIVVTPSHNPPADGGFKYNPPEGGPADTDVTGWIQDRANELLRGGNAGVERVGYDRALAADTTTRGDMTTPYVDALGAAIDLQAVEAAGIRIGVDPLGGAAVSYWEPIAQRYGLDLTVTDATVDPRFGFMTVDHDGKIRMDCSSPYAMAKLIQLKDRFDIAFGNDADADRHGIVAPSVGLLNPNHYLAVAIRYLLGNRPRWPASAVVGKTLVSSGLIDRVVADLGRTLVEVPVGFKWFAPGLFEGSCCFGGEESAGASFLRSDGTVWTTDKDGLLLGLLAAEITAKTGRDPGVHYRELTERFGTPRYKRVDSPATKDQKAKLAQLSPTDVADAELAGEPITAKLTRAPGNDAPIGGLKVVSESGWFAARPSGTEDVYKLYAESFRDEAHLDAILAEAQELIARTIGG